MKYEMRGYVFDSQAGMFLPILPGTFVAGYEEATELMKKIGCEYYMFALYKTTEKE